MAQRLDVAACQLESNRILAVNAYLSAYAGQPLLDRRYRCGTHQNSTGPINMPRIAADSALSNVVTGGEECES
jgi:hypothetical protein